MKRERKDSSRTLKKGLGRLRKGAGFTLLELMVVVVILAILSLLAIPRFTVWPKKAREYACFAEIDTLVSSLGLFKMDRDRYPTTGEGLAYLKICTGIGCPYPTPRRDFNHNNTTDTPWSRPPPGIDEYQYKSATPTSSFSIWVGESYANARTAVYKPHEGLQFRYP